MQQTCPRCRGEGKQAKNPCSSCRGNGTVEESRTLSVKVPAGVDTGDRIRLSGEGQAGARGGPLRRPLCTHGSAAAFGIPARRRRSAFAISPISLVDAVLGNDLEVPTLSGRVKLKIPAETQTGKLFRLRGKGITPVRGGAPGDLLYRLVVETPVGSHAAPARTTRRVPPDPGRAGQPAVSEAAKLVRRRQAIRRRLASLAEQPGGVPAWEARASMPQRTARQTAPSHGRRGRGGTARLDAVSDGKTNRTGPGRDAPEAAEMRGVPGCLQSGGHDPGTGPSATGPVRPVPGLLQSGSHGPGNGENGMKKAIALAVFAAVLWVLTSTRFGVFIVFDILGDIGSDNLPTDPARGPLVLSGMLAARERIPLPDSLEQGSGLHVDRQHIYISTDQAELFTLSHDGAEAGPVSRLLGGWLILRQGRLEGIALRGSQLFGVGELGEIAAWRNDQGRWLSAQARALPDSLKALEFTGATWFGDDLVRR